MRKLGKATMAAVLSTAMVMGNVSGNIPLGWNMQQVKAKDISYVELNEDFESSREVYFKLSACGSVSFQNEDGENEIATVELMSEDGNFIHMASTYCESVRLGVGTYKATIVSDNNEISKVTFKEEAKGSYEQEWNDTFDTANEIKTNSVYTGNLNNMFDWDDGRTKDVDYYKVILESPGKVYIQYTVENYLTGCSFWDYDDNENTVTLYAEDEDGNINKVTQVGGQYSENKTRYSRRYRLPKGNYYISVSGGYESEDYKYADITDYQLKVNYTEEAADKYEQEYNDTLDTANKISTNSAYTGNISNEKDIDYFTFTLDKKSNVKLQTKVPRQSTDKLFTFGIYKSNGTSKVVEVKSGTNPTAYTTEKELEPGTYYVIVKKGDAEKVESEVDYSINVMATEAQEIVATPTPELEEDTDSDNEQTGEDAEETAAPGAVATRQPIADDEEDTEESEPGAVATRVPVVTTVPLVTVAPPEDGDETDYDESEELITKAPVVTETPKQEEDAVPAVTKKPASSDKATEAPAPATKAPTASETTTNAPATNIPVDTNAQAKDNTNTTATVTAKPTEAPDMIDELRMYADVDKDEELRVGDQFNVYAEAVPDEMNTDLEVVWKSSNTKIATVSEEGEVTCKGAGTVSISASTTDGSKITVSMKFTIKKALSKVNTLSKITYTQGKLTPNFTKAKTSYTLTLGKNMSSTTIRYQKTDSASTVRINGSSASKLKVKLKPGESKTVKITVKAENGNSKTYKIKVRRKR